MSDKTKKSFSLLNGLADLKLFMNSGATAPEWALGNIVKVYTRDMTAVGAPTDVSYTGVGFKPSSILFICAVDNTLASSMGVTDSTRGEWCIATNRQNAGAGICEPISGYCIVLYTGAATSYQAAALKSLDADGFTLTWNKSGTPAAGTAQIYARCER